MTYSFNRSNTRRDFFLVIALIWLLHVRFSSINTPRDLVKFTLFNCVSLISKAGKAERLFNFCLDPININSVFVMLRVNLLAVSQRFIFDKS